MSSAASCKEYKINRSVPSKPAVANERHFFLLMASITPPPEVCHALVDTIVSEQFTKDDVKSSNIAIDIEGLKRCINVLNTAASLSGGSQHHTLAEIVFANRDNGNMGIQRETECVMVHNVPDVDLEVSPKLDALATVCQLSEIPFEPEATPNPTFEELKTTRDNSVSLWIKSKTDVRLPTINSDTNSRSASFYRSEKNNEFVSYYEIAAEQIMKNDSYTAAKISCDSNMLAIIIRPESHVYDSTIELYGYAKQVLQTVLESRVSLRHREEIHASDYSMFIPCVSVSSTYTIPKALGDFDNDSTPIVDEINKVLDTEENSLDFDFFKTRENGQSVHTKGKVVAYSSTTVNFSPIGSTSREKTFGLEKSPTECIFINKPFVVFLISKPDTDDDHHLPSVDTTEGSCKAEPNKITDVVIVISP